MAPLRARSHRPGALASLLVAVLLSAGACAPSREGPSDDGAERDARVETVLALRSAVGPPAAELGTAAASLVEQLEDLRADPPVEPADRVAAAGVIRDGALARLEAAREGITAHLAAGTPGPDAEAVRDALRDAASAAGDLAGAAADDLARFERVADADARLVEVVAAWEEPGSRSQQLTRLAEAVTRGEELAAELAVADGAPDCAGDIARRADAAAELLAGSQELRDLVERRRGEQFDARRRELASGPSASTRALVDADRAEVGCWREDAPVVAMADAVADALEDVEAALNPADLAAPDRGGPAD